MKAKIFMDGIEINPESFESNEPVKIINPRKTPEAIGENIEIKCWYIGPNPFMVMDICYDLEIFKSMFGLDAKLKRMQVLIDEHRKKYGNLKYCRKTHGIIKK
jgi:hypothetical protein